MPSTTPKPKNSLMVLADRADTEILVELAVRHSLDFPFPRSGADEATPHDRARTVLNQLVSSPKVLNSSDAWVIHACYAQHARLEYYGMPYFELLNIGPTVDMKRVHHALDSVKHRVGLQAAWEDVELTVPEIGALPPSRCVNVGCSNGNNLNNEVCGLARDRGVLLGCVIDIAEIGVLFGGRSRKAAVVLRE